KSGVEAWLAEREDACSTIDEREHRLVVGARAIVEHAETGSALRGALGREATRALALAPVLDDEGEVAGWLHVECEHHLLPSSARLAALGRAWRSEVLACRDRTECRAARAWSFGESAKASSSPSAEVFRELVAALGIKTHQRSWFGFQVDA